MNIFTQTSSILCFLLHSLSILRTSTSSDTMSATQILRDGDTLVSSGQTFELGFFSPGSSQDRYVGIWYNKITPQTVVWVANRASPLKNRSSGSLKISRSGDLIIVDETINATLWSTNVSHLGFSSSLSPVVQMLDNGNLVLREANTYLWQSFDYLTDTSIPGMDFGWNLATGSQIYLSSWNANDDPSPGVYTVNMDLTGYPQIFIKRSDVLQYRLGPYNGLRFSGMPNPKQNTTTAAILVMNSSEVYYRWLDTDSSVLMRFTLSPTGVGELFVWADPSSSWIAYYKFPEDMCDGYGTCGANGDCDNNNFPVCSCLDRFVPKDQASWGRSDWTGGCVRRTPMNCSGDGFLKYSGIKLPDSRTTRYNESSSLKECEAMCLSNCSCTAYTNTDISNGGSGCLMWFGDLIDIRDLTGENQVIYIRMAASELGSEKKRTVIIAVLASLGGFSLLVLSLVLFTWKRRKSRKLIKEEKREECGDDDLELPLYDLSTVTKATDGFSLSNKLGQGGFGPVYKGMLEDGKEIAVKRLSKSSSQGLEEFKNEVICIAKLQHRNLVKLLGMCVEGEEKMLIYEYMPNKSLDLTLFDESENKCLDWLKRLHIIDGIARGILYLHQDSCLRVIHRDLKASNILLDSEMNPRISDFGMARIFGGNETEGSTSRVVGTYGYMSPEYAVDGFFSTKSDVFSFGVLVLEIVSGRKNRGFRHMDHHHNLVGHAWMLYKEGRSLEIVDPNIGSSVYMQELLRSIHVALLCVQQRPDDRPSMSSVVLMLGSGGELPEAKEPGFFTERHGFVSENSSSSNATTSSNKYTITQVEAR